MNRSRTHFLALTSLSLGLLAAAPAFGASLTQVNRSEWASGVPNYLQLHIYVPDTLATKPPIVVSAHSCGSTAQGQMGNITKFRAAADQHGFILILPDNPGRNCWDVGTDASLKHDGGGDTQGIAQMVKYALTKYNGDASRVYIFGGSSGAMLTQAMLAVYPDLFKAGSARAGVAAGCWAVQFKPADQWSDPCAGGQVTHTAQEWGDLARAMYPDYTGPRPRVQLIHGGNDTLIVTRNNGESVKQWTNVLGLSAEPTSKDTGFKGQVANYDRQIWKSDCGFNVLESWLSPGGTHSMGYEEDAMLEFFALKDGVDGPDPADACSGGTGGSGGAGAGGAGGTSAGATGTSGTSGQNASGGGTSNAGAAGSNSGGSSGEANVAGSGGAGTGAPVSGPGGVTGSAGALATAGSHTAGSGGSSGSASLQTNAGATQQPSGGANGATAGPSEESGGCSVVIGKQRGRSTLAAVGLLLGFGLFFRRKQRS